MKKDRSYVFDGMVHIVEVEKKGKKREELINKMKIS